MSRILAPRRRLTLTCGVARQVGGFGSRRRWRSKQAFRPTLASIPGYDRSLIAGCAAQEYGGYMTDITRTWPVNGKFSEAQRDLYEAVLGVQRSCVSLCRQDADMSLDRLHEVAEGSLRDHLKKLGFDTSGDVGLPRSFIPTVRKQKAGNRMQSTGYRISLGIEHRLTHVLGHAYTLPASSRSSRRSGSTRCVRISSAYSPTCRPLRDRRAVRLAGQGFSSREPLHVSC